MRHPQAGALLAAAVIGLAGIAAAAPKPFEGTMAMTMEHDGKATPVAWSLKGKLARMEMEAGPRGKAVMIFDAPRQVMIMLMAERKMYMEMPVPKPQPAAKGAGKAGKAAKVVKTGRTEKILGYVCDEYRSTDENGTTEVWAAKGLGQFAPMGGGMGGGPPGRAARSPWEEEMLRGGMFPLRMIHKDKSGAEKGKMTVTAVTPQPMADDLFAPPADYQKFSMPAGMPGGMGGGIPPGGRPEGGGY